jgi:N-methylhydantoinase B
MRVVEPDEVGRYVRLHAQLELREFSCPQCATLLELEVCRPDEDSLWTMALTSHKNGSHERA